MTSRGVWSMVLGLVTMGAGVGWRYPGMLVLGAALTTIAGLAYASILAPTRLRAQRVVEPLEVPRNNACTGRLTIVHMGRMRSAMVDATEQVGGERVPVEVPGLPPGGQVEVEFAVPTRRRGLLTVGPLLLHRHGLLGLAVRTEPVGDVVTVRVLPRVLPVHAIPPGSRRWHVGADERIAHGGTDLVGLREYTPGDDLRRLHWATTARMGTLMVREDADPAMAHLCVLLDDRAESYVDLAFEDAVEVAASLASAAIDAGHPLRLLGASGRLDLDVPGAGPSGPSGPSGPGGPRHGASGVLAALADVDVVPDAGPVVPLPSRDRDVVAVVTGAGADLAPLVADAGRAMVGVVLVVDPTPPQAVQAVGAVLVLRGAEADDLLASWNRAVSESEP